MKKIFFVGILFAITHYSMAQGQLLVRTIQSIDPLLNEEPIDIYIYLPENYNPENTNKLIIGIHGLGNPDNSAQIRTYLTPVAEQTGSVLACPDPYLNDQPRSVAVVNQVVDSLLQWYNINETQKYIVGYSAGSDVAARYVLNQEKHSFKGLIWFAPGFYSITSVPNPETTPPICLCVGTIDFVSLAQANIINLAINNSAVPYLYNTISGVAHTMEFSTFPQEMMKCINFIDENNQTSIEEVLFKDDYSVYPNPTNDLLLIQNIDNQTMVRVFDLSGSQIISQLYSEQGINVSFLKSGVYFVEFLNDGKLVRSKFVKK